VNGWVTDGDKMPAQETGYFFGAAGVNAAGVGLTNQGACW